LFDFDYGTYAVNLYSHKALVQASTGPRFLKRGNFDDFFKAAMGKENLPYDYQRRLAEGDSGTGCHSCLINIPTGLGKTAAMAWLWNRVAFSIENRKSEILNPEWPLPMRTLVEQTDGPFRLAFFEAVFRAADIRVSGLGKS
jgi:hypothetical protein